MPNHRKSVSPLPERLSPPQPTSQTPEPLTPAGTLLVWMPVPFLLLAIALLWAIDSSTVYKAPHLLLGLNFTFSTLSSLLVAYLAARSFLAQGDHGVLLLGCGVLIWGTAGITSNVISPLNANIQITTFNLSVWASALCHLAGAVLSRLPSRPQGPPALWLPAAYLLALLTVTLASLWALSGKLPLFFIEGQGGTPIRQLVLGSAVAMFVLTAGLLARHDTRSTSRFLCWYSPALALVAVGLFGVLLQSSHGNLAGWAGRFTQWLGGIYMLLAALAVARSSKAWAISLEARLQQSERKYRQLFDSMTEGFLLIEMILDPAGKPVSYRYLDANPALERLTHLKCQDILGKDVREVLPIVEPHWIEAFGRVALTGEPLHLEEFSQALGGWFDVYAYCPERGKAALIYSNVSARKEAERALRESEQRLRLAQSAAQIGIFDWNLLTNELHWDTRLRELWHVGPEQPLSREFFEAGIHPDDKPAVAAALKAALHPAGTGHSQFEHRLVRNGQTRWLGSIGQVSFENGRPVRLVGTVQDITERKAFQEELQRLVTQRTAKLNELVGELEHFSYTITHDMRAPLRAMKAFGDVVVNELCASCPQQEPKSFLKRIMTSADRMDALIRDALNYNRAVRQELPLERLDPGELLQGMLNSYPELQPSRAHIRIEGPLPPVLGNEAGLTQCFSNLLGNAVKFVKPGQTPQIRIWSESRDGWVRLSVQDQGIGIPEVMLPRVFDMFSRGQNSHQGTGIGLALVRKVVDRMGGQVGVESEEGNGSRFWLELRAATA